MKVQLVTHDRHTLALCQDVVEQSLGRTWTLQAATGSTPDCGADLYVWDVQPETASFPTIDLHHSWRHFFLVDRSAVQQVRDALPSKDANILLKPVTRAALVAFLTDASARCIEENLPKSEDHRSEQLLSSLRSDRDELLQCLMQTNLKLQEYDHDRTNFLARAIHDFRAPLTAITGYCGLLLGEDVGTLTDEQREVLERMHRSAKKLSRMASAMFQLSIAPRSEAVLDLQYGEIRDCIEQASHEILPTAEEKRVSISLDITPPGGAVAFERTKLEQVLLNLLDNACKFSPRAGTIEIRAYPYHWEGRVPLDSAASGKDRSHEIPNFYRVDIRDSGPGIPHTHVTKIFEEYTSYGGGVDRSGGGLGLAICRMILDQHKGFIWANSSQEGAMFSFVLPVQHHKPAQIDPSAAKAVHAAAF